MRSSLADRFDGMDMGICFLTNYNLHFLLSLALTGHLCLHRWL